MRILVAAWAWPTHLYPLVPLARAFRAAGHEVVIASQPALLPTIRATGLPAAVVGSDADLTASLDRLLAQDPADRRPRAESRTVRRFTDIAEGMAPGLLALIRAWRPGLVLYEETTYAAPLAAQVCGVPAVRHLWGVDVMSFVRWSEPVCLAALAERLGASSSHGSLVTTIDPCPPSLQTGLADSGYHRTPLRYTPYNGTAPVPAWLHRRPSRPRVCVTYGKTLSHVGHARFLTGEIIAALGGLDVEVVAALSPDDRQRIAALPGNVTVAQGQPLADFLPGCALIVSHGGPGTVLTAAAHGVPQLILPQVADQRLLGDAVSAFGAGRQLPADGADAGQIRDAARELLASPQARRRAQALRAEIAARPGPADVARDLVASLG
jgi:UDP:flavonoid glycosyltransferase YjiC (YdhE family)